VAIMTADSPLTVHIWSDVACPWCYIGKRRFEAGVRAYGGPVVVEYHSFELSPDTPVDFDGSELDYLAGHMRIPKPQAQRMLDHVASLAAGEGLRYDFPAVRHTKTLLAHQALHHAKAHGLQEPLAERLFRAYFEQGRHIGHVDTLVDLAAEVGLDADGTRRALTDGRYADAVAEDIATARRLGINGVPFYVIDERFGVSGAQDSALFAEALRQAADTRIGSVQ
jgi:predicted DsbA family dithiol-disulfide isomerase